MSNFPHRDNNGVPYVNVSLISKKHLKDKINQHKNILLIESSILTGKPESGLAAVGCRHVGTTYKSATKMHFPCRIYCKCKHVKQYIKWIQTYSEIKLYTFD